MNPTRRNFLGGAVAANFALPIFGADAGKKYRTALIGAGWWGMNILRCAMEVGESKVVALADVDPSQIDAAYAEVEKLSGDQPKKYKDFRELLAKEKPDRKSTRLNSSHIQKSRMPSSA